MNIADLAPDETMEQRFKHGVIGKFYSEKSILCAQDAGLTDFAQFYGKEHAKNAFAAIRAIKHLDRLSAAETAMRELIEEWRRRVTAIGRDTGTYRQCADELAALLDPAK
jgi:hypothetical protein